MIKYIFRTAAFIVLVGALCVTAIPAHHAHAASLTLSADARADETANLLYQIQNLKNLIAQMQLRIQQGAAIPVTFASTNAFAIGDRVQAVTNLNVRSKPTTRPLSKILCTQPAGALGSVIGGPQYNNGYVWWNINFDTSCDGWSVETYLAKVDTAAPSVPTGLSASAVSSSQINLSWTASTDNVGVSGYTVYRNGVSIGTIAATSYSDNNLVASTTYSYAVSAFDAAGNASAQSASVSATTFPPAPTIPVAPSNLRAFFFNATSSQPYAYLVWQDNSNNENGFSVERGTDGINFSFSTTTIQNVTWYSDFGLASGTYFYRVDAFNGAGHSGYSNIATTTVP